MTTMLETVLTLWYGTKLCFRLCISRENWTSNYSDDELAQIEAAASIQIVKSRRSHRQVVCLVIQINMLWLFGLVINHKLQLSYVTEHFAANVYEAMQLHLNETFGSGSAHFTAPVNYLSGMLPLSGSNPYTYSSSSSSVYSNIYGNSWRRKILAKHLTNP